MKSQFPIKIDKPHRFTDVIAMVLAAGEVPEHTLRQNVPKAEQIAGMWTDGTLVAVGVLKHPRKTYLAGFYDKCGVRLDEQTFPLELGYIVVDKEMRGNGYSLKVVESLLPSASDRGVFATSFVENEPMHKTLVKCGFTQAGASYPGGNSGRPIQLFLRPGKAVGVTG